MKRNIRVGRLASLAAVGLGVAGAGSWAADRPQTEANAADRVVLQAVARPGLRTGPVLRGPGCPVNSLSRYMAPRTGHPEDLNFDNIQAGQQVTLQQGMIQGEVAAVSFQIPDSEFPIKMELIQAIFGSVSTQQTTTRYTLLLWDGPPTGTALYTANSDSADPAAPPDLVLPGGPGGTNAVIGDIEFSVDSQGDPNEDWVIPAAGTPGSMHTVSVGVRIDQHNAQSGTGCGFGDVPGNRNAFPATEPGTCCTTNLLTFPNDNWLFIMPCSGGCPAGWKRFSELAAGQCIFGQCAGCRPSGDWAIRFKYSSQVCLPAPTGSCCAASGACTQVTQANCTAGTWTQNGVCSPNPCPQPSGACCTSGACSTATQAQCAGTWQGAGTTCGTTNCPQPSGACCFGASSCQVLDAATCTGFGGTFIGNNVACGTGGVCPLGACCLPTGACVAGQSSPQCSGQGGTFQGVGSSCSPNNCPQPTGACCNSTSGFCGTLTQASCQQIPNTSWRGPLTTCTPNPCGETGACCNATACTVVGGAGSCGGSYQGSGTSCGAAGNPTTCCPANFNQAGGVTVQDIFDFLAAYFAGAPSADFNHAGGVTVQDIFDFLGAYFTGCPG